ncbi:hypothetical protein CRG98_004453 [Punica granatum]|uniref:Uncharacterized protein n=1 Tax=Punica granatum TaxID=22663 RepID=A0A2I0L345_PUNGR|nr:hypothetical protein CRG98_004453 [Punica granatum]
MYLIGSHYMTLLLQISRNGRDPITFEQLRTKLIREEGDRLKNLCLKPFTSDSSVALPPAFQTLATSGYHPACGGRTNNKGRKSGRGGGSGWNTSRGGRSGRGGGGNQQNGLGLGWQLLRESTVSQ